MANKNVQDLMLIVLTFWVIASEFFCQKQPKTLTFKQFILPLYENETERTVA
jgi:hypothetical protein